MNMQAIPFGTTDWASIPTTTHPGETGTAFWHTQHFGEIRVRMVEYTLGYLADHWCKKGHILLCLEDGRSFKLTPGISYQVADNTEAHRSSTATGATLFVVD
jgi:hypothetical protein